MTGKIKKDFRAAATIQVLLDLWSEWVQKGKVTLFSLSLSALIKVSSVWLALWLQDNTGQIQKLHKYSFRESFFVVDFYFRSTSIQNPTLPLYGKVGWLYLLWYNMFNVIMLQFSFVLFSFFPIHLLYAVVNPLLPECLTTCWGVYRVNRFI